MSAIMRGGAGRERPPLQRSHTTEDPPTSEFAGDICERRVLRAASVEAWAPPVDADDEADMTAAKKTRRRARHSAPITRDATSATPVGPRKEAWTGPPGEPTPKDEPPEPQPKPGRLKPHPSRPKSCVTPVSSPTSGKDYAEVTAEPKRREKRRGKESSSPGDVAGVATTATTSPKIEIKVSSAEETEASLPTTVKVTGMSPSPTEPEVPPVNAVPKTEPVIRTRLDLEPCSGLSIQKAPILVPKKDAPRPPEDDRDDDDDEKRKTQKFRGYRPKHGFDFLPFNKLFTKPSSSKYPSRSSSCDPELGVENAFPPQFSDCERDIISKTRNALKERISSANKRRVSNIKKKKIRLNIVMNAQPESDDSALVSDPEDVPRRPLSADSAARRKNKTKSPKIREQEPTPLSKKTPKLPTSNKKPPHVRIENKVQREEQRTKETVKRSKKKEIPTIMSEISPVASDIEPEMVEPYPRFSSLTKNYPNNRVASESDDNNCGNEDNLFVPERGGLLRTIINDANAYKPVTKTWRGNRMHLEVRIKTERAASSTEEEIEEEQDNRKMTLDKRKPKMIRPVRVGGVTSALGKMMAVRSMAGLLLPTSGYTDPKNPSQTSNPAVVRARERDKMRRILEVCAAKVEEAKQLSERLSADGVWISLDTLQRGLMSPTEYRVYQEHLRTLAEKEQQKRRPNSKRNTLPYRR